MIRRTALLGALLLTLPAAAVRAAENVPPDVPASTAAREAAESPAPPVAAKVTVTAHPVLEEIRYDPIAGAVTTVGAQQIEDLNAGDPAAALRRVPGLF